MEGIDPPRVSITKRKWLLFVVLSKEGGKVLARDTCIAGWILG